MLLVTKFIRASKTPTDKDDDRGRSAVGFVGKTGDCVTRMHNVASPIKTSAGDAWDDPLLSLPAPETFRQTRAASETIL